MRQSPSDEKKKKKKRAGYLLTPNQPARRLETGLLECARTFQYSAGSGAKSAHRHEPAASTVRQHLSPTQHHEYFTQAIYGTQDPGTRHTTRL